MREISTHVAYPFVFFNEEAFSRQWITREIVTGFMALTEEYLNDLPVMNAGLVGSKSPDLFKLGIFGRICTLDEDYAAFGFDDEANEVVRLIYKHNGNDLIATQKLWDEYEFQQCGFIGFGHEPDKMKLFNQDIRTVLEIENIFHVATDIDYRALYWLFDYEGRKRGEYISPFSKEGYEIAFKNIPIVRVW